VVPQIQIISDKHPETKTVEEVSDMRIRYLRFPFRIILLTLLTLPGCYTLDLSENLLFHPEKDHVLCDRFMFRDHLVFTEDSVRIECWMLSQDTAEVNFLFLPGNGWNLHRRIPMFNALGSRMRANIFAVNYRGFGRSDGDPTIEGILKDGKAAIHYFCSSSGLNRGLPTYLLGFSLGTFVALYSGQEESIAGMILLSPFSNAEEVVQRGKKRWIPFFARPFIRIRMDDNLTALDNLSLVRSVTKPVLFIHGQKDPFIPSDMSTRLYEACASANKKTAFIHNAGHFLCDKDCIDSVIDEIIGFLTALTIQSTVTDPSDW
jgi:fermentation-respiration switch protein FrsA (DUF1100 family)